MHELEQVNTKAFNRVMQPFSELNRLERQLNQAGKIAKKTALATVVAGGLTLAANRPAFASPIELSSSGEINWDTINTIGFITGCAALFKEVWEAYQGKRDRKQVPEAFLNFINGYIAGGGATYLVQTGGSVINPENRLVFAATLVSGGYVLKTSDPLLWFRQQASSLGAKIKDRREKEEQAAIQRDIALIINQDPEAISARRRLQKDGIEMVHRGGLLTRDRWVMIQLDENGKKIGEEEINTSS